jgi:hypothetical protein
MILFFAQGDAVRGVKASWAPPLLITLNSQNFIKMNVGRRFGNSGDDITKCRFAPFRYIGPRVKPAAMHLWLSATSHISRFSKSLRQVQALGLMDFGNPRPVIRNGDFGVVILALLDKRKLMEMSKHYED